ncbi:hypothetical protein AVEN_27869-1 [Araneus ventricosus]|uniref:Uncharacterized protein n=1 Tax=Araneus ventricosus TaxID=182803 RepID=A0A4Y2NP82_ARAVE|nr:hypothetical protein AVEN_27869-1 [Araneus ventricosus]
MEISKKKYRPKIAAILFKRDDDKKFRPRSGNQDWSSSESRNAFSVGRSKDWSESRRNQMYNTKKMKRDQDEWFMSSEENMRISPPQIDRPIWKDDRSDWHSDQNYKGASSSKNAKAGFSRDRNDKRPWSSDNPNKPWSSTKMQMDDNFDSRRKGSWSSDENVDENKRFGSGSKGGSWSSGSSSKNDGFPPSSRDRSWSSDDKDFKRDDPRSGYSDANIKPDWSSKPRDSQEDWPSTKSRSRDGRTSFDKPNRSSRQDPKDWPSDTRKPIPPVRDGRAWDMDDKRDSNFPSSGNKKGWSSSRRSSKDQDSWTSDDQQTKADWSSNKGDWSDRRKSQPSDSRKGRQNTQTHNKRGIDSTWTPSSDRSDWSQDSQRDISDWSEDDRQSRSDDWSSKNKGNIPSFNTDKGRGRDFKASESRNSKDDWLNDNRRDNSDWSSDKRTSARDEWDKRGRSDEQKPSSWSSDDRQVSSDESSSQNDWSFDNQKDISDDDRSSKDWQAKSKNKSSGGTSWGDDDSLKASLGSKTGWDSKGSISNQKPSSIKGNKPVSPLGQNGWNDPQIQTGRWKMELPKDASDWSSSLPDNKRASTKTKGKVGPISQSRWADGDRSSRSPNSPSRMDEDWPLDVPLKPGPMTGIRPDKDSSSGSDSGDSGEDWPSDNAGKPSWSSDTRGNKRTATKGSESAWNQDASPQTNVKSQNPVGSWNTKGKTKTAMVMPSTSKGIPGMMPRKPWRDDTDQTNPMKNIKGDPAMKEEKIVWSVQISSNGETGNGWVPITLRPEFKKRVNQTRDQNNDKGTPMTDDGWSGLEQKSDSWDSAGQDKMAQPPQFRTDMITESVPSSTQMLDSSDSHPFYIPVTNNRFKREAKPILRIRHHIRPRDNARTIYKVIRNGIELKNNRTNHDNRFYLASANILVGDNHSSNKLSSGFGNRHKPKLDIIGKREYNETIKKTVPSLIQIRNLKHGNFTAKNVKRFKSIQDWDGLMQESETKESWSAPIDDSNVPASGWIPLFRVVKVPTRNPADLKKNASKLEEKNTEIKRIITSESTVYIDAKTQQTNSSNFLVPNESAIKNVTIELPRTELKSFKMKNITVDKQMHEKQVNFEQEMKVGNQTLRIIPFSDIMKQLRVKPTELSSADLTTSTVSSTTTEDEWNIPITASPKTYAIKLVNGSEMQNHNHTNSWTFTKRTPKGHEAWILVKENHVENKTMPNENRNSTNLNPKATENDGFIRIPYKIIVGNRTVGSEESPRLSERKRAGNNPENKPNNPPNPPTKEFSFDLKNWQKDSGWTPLLRAVGSVKPKKIDSSANKSAGDG